MDEVDFYDIRNDYLTFFALILHTFTNAFV